MTSSSLRPTRRSRIFCTLASVSKRQCESSRTIAMGMGHSSAPTSSKVWWRSPLPDGGRRHTRAAVAPGRLHRQPDRPIGSGPCLAAPEPAAVPHRRRCAALRSALRWPVSVRQIRAGPQWAIRRPAPCRLQPVPSAATGQAAGPPGHALPLALCSRDRSAGAMPSLAIPAAWRGGGLATFGATLLLDMHLGAASERLQGRGCGTDLGGGAARGAELLCGSGCATGVRSPRGTVAAACGMGPGAMGTAGPGAAPKPRNSAARPGIAGAGAGAKPRD